MEKTRFVVDFQVTGKCNMACNFCDGAPKYMKGETLEDIKLSIEKLTDVGLDTLVISGGEPLLRKDIVEIIKFGYYKGIEIYLSTNGVLLSRFYQQIKDYLKCIGLPLDGHTKEINDRMTRGPKQYEATTNILRYFKTNSPNHIVKVGTVVSKINIDYIFLIADLLFNTPEFYSPDTWRLYQFTPLGDGLFSRNIHYLTDEEFNNLVLKVKGYYPKRNITTLSNEESNDSYIFINPELDLQVLTDDTYLKIGNMKDMGILDLIKLKEKYLHVINKGRDNRRWLDNAK